MKKNNETNIKRRGRPPKNKLNKNETNEIDTNEIDTINSSMTDSIKEFINDNNIENKIIQNNDYDNDYDDDYVRPPDEIRRERLIDNNYEDDELLRIINLSRMEYLNSLNNNNLNNNNLNNNTEENIDEDLQKVLELSKTEVRMYEEMIDENILNESKENEIKKRSESLPNFIKLIQKINTIYFSEKEYKLKLYIEEKLNEYFNLEIDYININDEELYGDLYKMIDSYYLIPINKKYKKTLITKEEDDIIRNIFRK